MINNTITQHLPIYFILREPGQLGIATANTNFHERKVPNLIKFPSVIYCTSGNFRVFEFSRISDFATFHEV